LKQDRHFSMRKPTESHPVRVRGLKLVKVISTSSYGGRTPCGCVD